MPALARSGSSPAPGWRSADNHLRRRPSPPDGTLVAGSVTMTLAPAWLTHSLERAPGLWVTSCPRRACGPRRPRARGRRGAPWCSLENCCQQSRNVVISLAVLSNERRLRWTPSKGGLTRCHPHVEQWSHSEPSDLPKGGSHSWQTSASVKSAALLLCSRGST